MAAEVIGISGSPVPNSNTDRAIELILKHTHLTTEFVKLSEFDFEPCRACLACVKTNRCAIEDDGQALADKFRAAKGFVLGGYTPYSSLDARTKMFMERMYCLRHKTGLNRGKPGVSVVTSAYPVGAQGLPPAAHTAQSQIGFWMTEEQMVDLGSMVVLGNMPCIRCGFGDDCELSGVRMIGGADATVASVGVKSLESDCSLIEVAMELGARLREAVLARGQLKLRR